jgi:predicted 3-demethylubiquinone-9 3-methyltransferase (glyoxalase superfamily)
MQKITPYLWFNTQAEEAVKFYTSIFKNSKVESLVRYGEEMTGQAGQVMNIVYELEGQKFFALNGGPAFSFTPAVSFFVECADQEEVDYYWDRLSEGGTVEMCGWLRDKYGVSWQIIPTTLMELMSDSDPVKAGRVTQAMLQMQKIDVAKLKQAYAQGLYG